MLRGVFALVRSGATTFPSSSASASSSSSSSSLVLSSGGQTTAAVGASLLRIVPQTSAFRFEEELQGAFGNSEFATMSNKTKKVVQRKKARKKGKQVQMPR
eukprot:TRINITY_DN2158_c0_g1_i1.p2 TRINITY_DN2158_c0_g1~~TRINITY_DN2158_c0_g1_i1.p2  ORF type:complete len:101 (-),score=38.06 TRINITY_DN2158_c0_g1_i1:156-458(-)